MPDFVTIRRALIPTAWLNFAVSLAEAAHSIRTSQ
jgi:hypothetical protein